MTDSWPEVMPDEVWIADRRGKAASPVWHRREPDQSHYEPQKRVGYHRYERVGATDYRRHIGDLLGLLERVSQAMVDENWHDSWEGSQRDRTFLAVREAVEDYGHLR